MAICNDCAHKQYCTFPRTEHTQLCEEHDNLQRDQKPADWDLKKMLQEWGLLDVEKN